MLLFYILIADEYMETFLLYNHCSVLDFDILSKDIGLVFTLRYMTMLVGLRILLLIITIMGINCI